MAPHYNLRSFGLITVLCQARHERIAIEEDLGPAAVRAIRRNHRASSHKRDNVSGPGYSGVHSVCPYEVQAFPWSGLSPFARASASDM